MPDELAVLFIDTNILLHFRPLQEIDWRSVADAKAVRLVLCSPVLDELDDRKNEPKTAERARSAIAQLRQIGSAHGQVRNDVTLETIADDEEAYGNRDAAIIQRVRDYCQQHPGERVAVVSDDYNMSLRCRAKGVACLGLDEKWRKPLEDEAARKLRQTQQELAALKSQLPAFHVNVVAQEGDPIDQTFTVTLSRPPAPIDVEPKVAKACKEHPPMKPGDYGLSVEFSEPFVRKGPGAFEQYNQQLEDYYGKFRKYWQQMNEYRQADARAVRFFLVVENCGGKPAESLQVYLRFPPRFYVVTGDCYEGARPAALPDPPKEPLPPLQQTIPDIQKIVVGTGCVEVFRRAPLPAPVLPDPWAPSAKIGGDADNGFVVEAYVKRLRHHDSVIWGEFIALFNTRADIKPFEAEYEIKADNHPQRLTGKVLFLAHKEEDGEAQEPC